MNQGINLRLSRKASQCLRIYQIQTAASGKINWRSFKIYVVLKLKLLRENGSFVMMKRKKKKKNLSTNQRNLKTCPKKYQREKLFLLQAILNSFGVSDRMNSPQLNYLF